MGEERGRADEHDKGEAAEASGTFSRVSGISLSDDQRHTLLTLHELMIAVASNVCHVYYSISCQSHAVAPSNAWRSAS